MSSYVHFDARKFVRTTNPALRVTGYQENKAGEVFVKGISLESGEEIIAKLDVTENNKRPSLAQLRDGYKIKGTMKVLEPGGILVLDKAYRAEGDKVFTARWPSVMAYTAEEAKNGNVATAMFTLHAGKKQDGSPFGYALKYAPEAKHFINGKTAEDLRQGIEAFASKVDRPAFTVRAFKNSASDNTQELVTSGRVLSSWNREEKRAKTPQEMASSVVAFAKMMQQSYPNTTLSVVPAMLYSISRFTLEDSKKFELLEKVASHFHDKDDVRSCFAKKCCVKLGGEHHEFINDIKVIDPYGAGIDPAHMSGLVPAQDEAPKEDPDMAPPQRVDSPATVSVSPPAAESTPPENDPFAEVENDGPSL